MTAIRVRRRAPRRGRADRWSDALRGAAVTVVVVGAVGSGLIAKGWASTVTRQRDERLDRTATTRTVTISSVLANHESALQAARSLYLASNSLSRREFSTFARSLDLDRFKAYNDEHGHQAGDRLLKAAAAAWEGRLRKTDLLARYGGEEFAILLPDCALDDAMEIAERLRTAQPEGTCSIGVADWDGREDLGHLVARADRALYAAKAAGSRVP